MSDVKDLVALAASGDEAAWADLVERYSRLVWAIVRSYRLSHADAADVSQTTWLRMVEHLSTIRDPSSVGAWIATTTRRECLRVLRASGRVVAVGDEESLELHMPSAAPAVDEHFLQSVAIEELWTAFSALPDRCRTLLRVLMADPPPSYDEVGVALDMPIGSIGPTRARCIERLRRILEPTSIKSGSEGSSQTSEPLGGISRPGKDG